MTKKDFIKMTTCAAIFGLVGGATFQGGTYFYNHLGETQVVESVKESSTETPKIQTTTLSSTVVSATASESGVSKIAENVLPSIVAIDVVAETTSQDFLGRTYSQESSGSGSGIIVAQNGNSLYIATNNHVVEGAKKVTVKFNDGSSYEAEVKGTDADYDLAVVSIPMSKLSSDTMKNIKVATLGDSDKVKVGNQAIAIGNALGYGTSVTVGYISAKDREINAEDSTMKLLQTDAAINPGNSGGALVDANGAVIGINSAKFADTEVEGMGFAIPVSTAIPIINDIMNSEKLSEDEQGYLGIKGTDVEEEYTKYYNIPQGIYVKEVTENSPAAKAGLKTGDVIVKFGDRELTSMTGLQERLAKTKAGSTVTLVVKRADDGEYKEKTLTVTLGSKKEASSDSTQNDSRNDSQGQDSQNGYGRNDSDGSRRMPEENDGQRRDSGEESGQDNSFFGSLFGDFYGN